ncbi:MAG: DsbA family protein, partial [Crocinitomicaceae bacterium]
VACPWCYVGKRRFEAALEQWEGTPVEVNWHPYQLDPTMGSEGISRDAYLINKFGSVDGMQEVTNRLTSIGTGLGIDFDFGESWTAYNTLHLHQLLHVAGQEGFKAELKERFLKAYFVDLSPLNDSTVLHTILADFGWDSTKVDAIINDQSIAQQVQAEIAHFQKMGVSGVPFFILNGKYGISGAQESKTFLEALNQIDAMPAVSEGESCEPGSDCC